MKFVAAACSFSNNEPIDRQKQRHHRFHSLHHLLAGEEHAEALPKVPFQRVVGHLVVKTTEQEVDSQPKA